MRYRQFCWLTALCVSAFVGCGGSGEPTSDGGPAANGTDGGPKRVGKEELVVVHYGFSALDDGRIEVGAPVGWGPGPRQSNDWLIWFIKKNVIPQIIVLAKSPESGFGPTLTEDKLVEFAAAIEKRLADGGRSLGKGLVEPVRPLIIVDRPCVRYVSRFKLTLGPTNTPTVESQVLVTILNGRQYTVELRVRDEDDPPDSAEDELLAEKNAAYAVLHGLRPVGAASAPEAPKDPPAKEVGKDG